MTPPAPIRWAFFYAPAATINVAAVSKKLSMLFVDVDPTFARFDPADVRTFKVEPGNLVLSYLDVGSCESYRSWWTTAPADLVPCGQNTAAQIGSYIGYPDEVWMNPANEDYQRLVVEHVAQLLADQGVDGFYLDNLDLVDHGVNRPDGPCDEACVQGLFDLLGRLRARFPRARIIANNASSPRLLTGRTSAGVRVATLLDGITREGTFVPDFNAAALDELRAWRDAGLTPGGRRFFVGTIDYVGTCSAVDTAREVYKRSGDEGLNPYCTADVSGPFCGFEF